MLIRAGAETSKENNKQDPAEHACEEIRIFLLVGISSVSCLSDPSSILGDQEPG